MPWVAMGAPGPFALPDPRDGRLCRAHLTGGRFLYQGMPGFSFKDKLPSGRFNFRERWRSIARRRSMSGAPTGKAPGGASGEPNHAVRALSDTEGPQVLRSERPDRRSRPRQSTRKHFPQLQR
jgi:hypothetical protein